MATFIARLKSIQSNFRGDISICPLQLAHAGFHCADGKLRCFSCNFMLANLEDLFEPHFEHIFHSEDLCPYLLRTTGIYLSHGLFRISFFVLYLRITRLSN